MVHALVSLNARREVNAPARGPCVAASGCGSHAPEDEIGQSVGDAMASADDSGGTNGTYALADEIQGARRTFARRMPGAERSWVERHLMPTLLPEAEATSCLLAPGFGS